MKKGLLVLIGTVIIGAMLLVACSSGEAKTTANPAAAPVQGSSSSSVGSYPIVYNGNSQGTGIWVSGTGKVTATPDVAILTLGVQAQAKTVADATSQAATAMDAVHKVLISNGVAEKDIKTQGYSISPVTQWVQSTQEQITTGYMVSNTVTVKIRTLDKVGSIIDAAAAAGGDLTRVNGISFTIDDPTPYTNQARAAAMQDAMAKAQQMAQIAGVTLGKATYITETSSYIPSPIPMALSGKADSTAPSVTTPINPGDTDITVSVQMGFAIQ